MSSKKIQGVDIDDELVDEIVDEILAEGIVPQKQAVKVERPVKSARTEEYSDNGSSDISARLEALENKVNSYISNYKITAVELERQIAEKSEEFNKEQEKQLLFVQDQLVEFRSALIKLSNEFKKSRESVAQK